MSQKVFQVGDRVKIPMSLYSGHFKYIDPPRICEVVKVEFRTNGQLDGYMLKVPNVIDPKFYTWYNVYEVEDVTPCPTCGHEA